MLFICHAGAGGEAASQTAAARITVLSKYDMKGEREREREGKFLLTFASRSPHHFSVAEWCS